MISLVLILIFCLIALLTSALYRSYRAVPAAELKRRAQAGDGYAQTLFRAASYGGSLYLLLWLIGIASLTTAIVILARWLPWPLAWVLIVVLTAGYYVWLPRRRSSGFARAITKWISPVLAWVLNYIHVPLHRCAALLTKTMQNQNATQLFEKSDLVTLLKQQSRQTHNRIAKEELFIAQHALTFGDRLVRDVFIPMSQVVGVAINDTIGPKLMDELHASGHSRFLVYEKQRTNVVGILYLHDLLTKRQGGSVETVVRRKLVYAHEEQTLFQTLQAFLKTKQQLFVVVNRFEEVIGIITIEDILEQIIGRPIVDEFDRYDDLRAVAERVAKETKHQHPPESR